MTEIKELSPCPFCGGKLQIKEGFVDVCYGPEHDTVYLRRIRFPVVLDGE